jgi:hypothetical protein
MNNTLCTIFIDYTTSPYSGQDETFGCLKIALVEGEMSEKPVDFVMAD